MSLDFCIPLVMRDVTRLFCDERCARTSCGRDSIAFLFQQLVSIAIFFFLGFVWLFCRWTGRCFILAIGLARPTFAIWRGCKDGGFIDVVGLCFLEVLCQGRWLLLPPVVAPYSGGDDCGDGGLARLLIWCCFGIFGFGIWG